MAGLLTRYAKKIGTVMTKPFSKKITYDFRSAKAKADQKDPSSPSYKKNMVDRFVDRVTSN